MLIVLFTKRVPILSFKGNKDTREATRQANAGSEACHGRQARARQDEAAMAMRQASLIQHQLGMVTLHGIAHAPDKP